MSSAAVIAIPTADRQSPIHVLSRDLDPRTMPQGSPTVFVVDGDIEIRESLELLILSQGWQPRICDSSLEFLARSRPSVPCCLILAYSSEDSNCLEVQKRIARECAEVSIVVIADYEDIPTAVQAIKAGAVDFLVKPYSHGLLMNAIRQGLLRSRAAVDRATEMRELRNRYASLTPREQQVLRLVAAGLLNKQVAGELGISEFTVKAHRGQVTQKMKADSFAHLVNMASKLRLAKVSALSVVSH